MRQTIRPPFVERVSAYVALTKPRIIELLLVTTVPTMIVADRGLPSLWLMAATVIGGSLAAGGANAFNMYVDRDIDALMERTKSRPLVTGVIEPPQALAFASILEVVAFFWLWGWVNFTSAALAVAACLFYVFVYTLWLKRTSTHNIVIGGAAGAVPVLIGWTAVTNSLSWVAILLFAIIFCWTPPHFWALAIKYKEDYCRAEVPMLPSVADFRTAANRIVGYTILVWSLTIVLTPVAGMGYLYTGSAVVLGGVFSYLVLRLRRQESAVAAMRVFSFSITYIVLLFGAMAADRLLQYGL